MPLPVFFWNKLIPLQFFLYWKADIIAAESTREGCDLGVDTVLSA